MVKLLTRLRGGKEQKKKAPYQQGCGWGKPRNTQSGYTGVRGAALNNLHFIVRKTMLYPK